MCTVPGHRGRRENSAGPRRRPRRLAGVVSDRNRGADQHRSRLRQVHRLQARLRPHGDDRLRSERVPAVRHGRRQAERGPAEHARGGQHPRRAFGDVQGCVRCSAGNAAARRCARRVRGVSQAARCARDGRVARCAVRTQPRPRSDAALLRGDGQQGHLRREGHAHHGRRRRQLCDGRTAQGLDARGAPTRVRRDHVRASARVRVQRRQRRPGRRGEGRTPLHRPGRLARVMGRHDLQPVRHRARDERLERRLGRGRRGESRDVLDLRDDGRLVPRSRQLSGRRAHRADEGHDLVRRRARRASLPGPSRNHLPHGH